MTQEQLIEAVRRNYAAMAVPRAVVAEQLAALWAIVKERGTRGLREEWRTAIVTVLIVLAYITEKSSDGDKLLFGSQVDDLAADEEIRYRMHVIAVACNEEPVSLDAWGAGPLGGLKDAVVQAFLQRVLDVIWQHLENMDVMQILDMVADKLGDLINE